MTLKNDKTRREYIKDPGNWGLIAELAVAGKNGSLRIEGLKGIPIVRLCGWIDPGYGLGRRWVTLGAYEINPDTGALKSVYSLSVPQIAQRLRELKI